MSTPASKWRRVGKEPARCCAPVGNGDGKLCGVETFEARLVEGIMMPLCKEHAAELDRERVEN